MISTTEIYNILLFEFPYFKKINEEKRQLLCKRTKHFIEGTDFIPRKGFVLTNRMQILISACSQQLTLAFPKHYDYAYFGKIIVYPEKYYSTYTDKYHTGEMNTAGIVVLSWEDFYKGISVDNDTRNVGLHEFAHALEFTDIANKDIDEIFSACLDKFTALADHYLQHQPEKPLFRSYATTNLSEFFAVATEYYFEAPTEFAEQEPELFDILNKAYQQNTAPKISVKNNLNVEVAGKHYLGNETPSVKSGDVFAYLIIVVIAVILAYYLSVIAAVIFALVFLCLNRLAVPVETFLLYEGYVKIKQDQTLTKRSTHNSIIQYSDVIYVNAVYFEDDEGGGKGYRYTLFYFQGDRLLKAHYTTFDLDYERVLKFLYLDKKVGTRLDGTYKKYKFNKA